MQSGSVRNCEGQLSNCSHHESSESADGRMPTPLLRRSSTKEHKSQTSMPSSTATIILLPLNVSLNHIGLPLPPLSELHSFTTIYPLEWVPSSLNSLVIIITMNA
jgi:hypothetical protein